MSKRDFWIDDRCALVLGGIDGPRLVVRSRSVLPMGEEGAVREPHRANASRERMSGGEARESRPVSGPPEP